MMRRGFTALKDVQEEGVALVITLFAMVLMIPGGGWGLAAYQYAHHKNVSVKTSKPIVQAPKSFKLVIKEWGVALPLSQSIRDAYYQINTDGTVSVSSWKLESLDEQIGCTSGLGPVLLARLKVNTSSTGTAVSTSVPANAKKNGEWYYYEPPQADITCVLQPSALTTQASAVHDELESAVKNLKTN